MSDSLFRAPRKGRLAGRAIFLSASVPSADRSEKYRRLAAAQVEIEDAVVSLARAVFSEGGELVFGGHPAISPLVAMVAGEYVAGRRSEEHGSSRSCPVVIHQLEAYRNAIPDATAMMSQLGQATVVWHSVVSGEDLTTSVARPTYPLSLRRMRREMVRSAALAAMVCIGGMEGVEEEVQLFSEERPEATIFLLAGTGGASAVLARSDSQNIRCRVIDDALMADLSPHLRGPGGSSTAAPLSGIPYPFIMQRLIQEVAENEAR